MDHAANVSDLGDAWSEPDAELASNLAHRLRESTHTGHLLEGVEVAAVAVKRNLKDVVFWLPGPRQWALVHLTDFQESDPRFPSTIVVPNWGGIVYWTGEDAPS